MTESIYEQVGGARNGAASRKLLAIAKNNNNNRYKLKLVFFKFCSGASFGRPSP